jgi:hypothetical protein
VSDGGDRPLPDPVDAVHRESLRLGPVRIADPPIPYRAYQRGRWRFGWSGPGIRFRLSTAMIPSHFALTLELMPNGEWRLREQKSFETEGEARRWAESLWREAVAQAVGA